MSEDAGGELLDGPRGRRLCWSLLEAANPSLRSLAWRRPGPVGGLATDAEVADAITEATPHTAASLDSPVIMAALIDTVGWARYWQPPDDEDRLLAEPTVRTALAPLAEAVVDAMPAWWHSPVDLQRQRYVQWLDETPREPPALVGASTQLSQWRAATGREETRAAERPSEVSANVSGAWWSTPALSTLVSTTRSLPEIAAVGLALVEDSFGWREARLWPLRTEPGRRVFELTGAVEWAELVRRYPLNVTLSKRHDWWNATGIDGGWLIPDWAAVAGDYDAVHLSVCGYLSTAGRAVVVNDSRTVLAGWNPDETYWLTDALESAGDPTEWSRDESNPPVWQESPPVWREGS